MRNLPMREAQFRTAEFLAWIVGNGAEVCPPTNPYEVVRYRAYTSGATKALTHIVYRKDSGLLTWTGASMKHYQAFLDGEEFAWSQPYDLAKSDKKPKAKKASKGPKAGTKAASRAKLMDRDGTDCWFCSLPLGEDITLEHLVPQSRGGGNDIANLVLAHAVCNRTAADLSLSEKIAMRSRMQARATLSPEREG
jgi:hypothetical protein